MVSLADIQAAEIRISPHIIHTPLVYSPTISEITGAKVYLKLETLQKAGSFKVRGATNKILSHINAIREQGVIAASDRKSRTGCGSRSTFCRHSRCYSYAGMVFPFKAGSDQGLWGTGDYSRPDVRGEYREGTGDCR